jgi:hypothetical protein
VLSEIAGHSMSSKGLGGANIIGDSSRSRVEGRETKPDSLVRDRLLDKRPCPQAQGLHRPGANAPPFVDIACRAISEFVCVPL